jgi:hypothetical protein
LASALYRAKRCNKIASINAERKLPFGSIDLTKGVVPNGWAECRLGVDTVKKGICRTLEAALIQDWEPMRNLDSKFNCLD